MAVLELGVDDGPRIFFRSFDQHVHDWILCCFFEPFIAHDEVSGES